MKLPCRIDRIYTISVMIFLCLTILQGTTKAQCLRMYYPNEPEYGFFNPDSVMIDTCDKRLVKDFEKMYAKKYFSIIFETSPFGILDIKPENDTTTYHVRDMQSQFVDAIAAFTELEKRWGVFSLTRKFPYINDTSLLSGRTFMLRFDSYVKITDVLKYLNSLTSEQSTFVVKMEANFTSSMGVIPLELPKVAGKQFNSDCTSYTVWFTSETPFTISVQKDSNCIVRYPDSLPTFKQVEVIVMVKNASQPARFTIAALNKLARTEVRDSIMPIIQPTYTRQQDTLTVHAPAYCSLKWYYQWAPIEPAETTSTIVMKEYGTYWCDVTFNNACVLKRIAETTKFKIDPTVVEEDLIDGIHVYPNPVAETAILTTNQDITNVILYSMVGAEVCTWNTVSKNQPVTLPVLTDGVYYIRYLLNSRYSTIPLVVKKH